MCRYVFVLVGTCVLITICNSSKISDLRLCADENCETIISHAKSLARVNNPDTTFLSFERGSVVNVISKSAGNRPDLWGGEINGRRGYFPRSFVREFHVLIPNPEKVVPTEPHASIEERILGQAKADEAKKKEETTPDKPEQPEKDETEVVDETEIADDDDDAKEDNTVTESKDEQKNEKDAEKQDSTLKQAEQEQEKQASKGNEAEKQSEPPKQTTQEKEVQQEIKTDTETEKVVQKDEPSQAETGQKDAPSQSETGQKDAPSQAETGQKDTPSQAETGQKDSSSQSETGQKDAPSQAETGQKDTPEAGKDEKQSEPETKAEEEVDETEIDKEFEDDWGDETEMLDDEEDEEDQQKTATKLNDILHHRQEQKAEDDKSAVPETKSEELQTPNEKKEQDTTEKEVKPEDVQQQEKKDGQEKSVVSQQNEQTKPVVSGDEKPQEEVKLNEPKVVEDKPQAEKINQQGQVPGNENVPVSEQTVKEVNSEEGSVNTGTITQDSGTAAEQVLQASGHTDRQPVEQPGVVSGEQPQTQPKVAENVPQELDDTEPKEEEQAHTPVEQQTETATPADDIKSSEEKEHKIQDKVKAGESQVKSEEQRIEPQVSHEHVKQTQEDLKATEQQKDQLNFEQEPQKDVKEEDKLAQNQEVQDGKLEVEMNQAEKNEMRQKPEQTFSQSPEEKVAETNQEQIKETPQQVKQETAETKPEESAKTDQESQREQVSPQDTEQQPPKDIPPETKTLEENKVEEKPVQEPDVKPDLTTEQSIFTDAKPDEQTRYNEDVRSSQTASFTQDVPRQEPTPVLEPSTTQSINTVSDMEGYTVIDGTPFPLDYFDDPTDMEKSVTMETSQSQIVPTPVLMNTQTYIRQETGSVDTETQSSYREQEKPNIDQDQKVQHTSEQLMSSMKVEQFTTEQRQVTDAPETMQPNQTNMDKDAPGNELPDQVAPDNKDGMYATMDFLSRKPLSHDVNVQKSANEQQEQQRRQEQEQQQQQEQERRQHLEQQQAQEQQTQYHQQAQEQQQPQEQQQEQHAPTQEQQPPPETVTDPTYQQQQEVPKPPTQENEAQQNEEIKDENVDIRDKDTTTLPFSDFDFDVPKDYNTENIQSRKIDDDKLEDQEDKEYKSQQIWTRAIKNLENRLKLVVEKLPPSVQSLLEQEPLGMSPWMTVLVTLSAILTLITLSCVGLICGGSKKQKKKDPVVVVKGLEEQLFIMTKEKENLEDELQSVRASIQDKEKEILLQKTSSGSINTELNNLRVLNNELQHNIATLEAEIRELHSDADQKTKTAQSKQDKLAECTKQLKQKETKLHEAEERLKKTNKELNDNREELKTYKNKVNSLTDQVQHLETRKQQLTDEAEDWDEKVKDLTERLTEATSGQKQIQENLAFKENELEVLRDCFLQLKSFESETDENTDNVDGVDIQDKLKSMMDVSKINASLRTIEEEKNLLQHRVDIEIQARAEMEEQIADLERKAESLQMDKMKADRQSHDLQTKLNVLSNYFKEKELQLQKELGEQQALKTENINKLESAGEQTQMIKHERDLFKMQVEDLKTEIVSAEKDFRSQIATNEKKAHENWLAARSAERELKEARHDNTVLRQKLTDLERRLLQGPSGLIRPLPTRGMPPQGLMNGPPPPPGMDRPGSRPPPGPPPLRDDDYRGSPDRPGPPPGARVPPPHLDSRSPPLGPRMPPPMDTRTPPPYDRRPPPHDRRSPPMPFDRGIRFPPHMDRRSPGYRMPPPDMSPLFRGPFPPHGPTSPPPPRNELPDSNRFMGSGTPRYPPPPQERDHTPRQQSQV